MLDSAELQSSPSPEPTSPPAGETPPSAEPSGEPSEPRSWWSRLWNTRGHHAVNGAEDEPAATESSPEEPIAPAPRQVTLTEEELQQRVQRQAQSLHDREVARRNREATEAERRRMRDEDPVGFAELEQAGQLIRQQQLAWANATMGEWTKTYDAHTLDPIFLALPEKERTRLQSLPQFGQGLPGRKLVVDEALKSYGRLEYERGVRETQAKLRKDPVFRKSVLSELRGNFEEPELYPGDSPREVPEDNVSNRLRTAFFNR